MGYAELHGSCSAKYTRMRCSFDGIRVDLEEQQLVASNDAAMFFATTAQFVSACALIHCGIHI